MNIVVIGAGKIGSAIIVMTRASAKTAAIIIKTRRVVRGMRIRRSAPFAGLR